MKNSTEVKIKAKTLLSGQKELLKCNFVISNLSDREHSQELYSQLPPFRKRILSMEIILPCVNVQLAKDKSYHFNQQNMGTEKSYKKQRLQMCPCDSESTWVT